MEYVELMIPVEDDRQAEIYMAELSDYPFESFQTDSGMLKAYIRNDDLEACQQEIELFTRSLGVKCIFTVHPDINWNEAWESEFHPVDVEGRYMIRAPFHVPAPDGCMDVVIMPKMSFGTGHHATTYLMVVSMSAHDFTGLSGLDMGSGTGVLAIIAAKLGAVRIDAVDIDKWAYENSVENIRDNGVEKIVIPALGDVSLISDKSYDFILANINRNIIIADIPRYIAAMKPGAFIILSGILEQDIPDVRCAAEANGLALVSEKIREGWAALEFVKA